MAEGLVVPGPTPEAGRLGPQQEQREREQQVEAQLDGQGPGGVEAAAGALLVVEEGEGLPDCRTDLGIPDAAVPEECAPAKGIGCMR